MNAVSVKNVTKSILVFLLKTAISVVAAVCCLMLLVPLFFGGNGGEIGIKSTASSASLTDTYNMFINNLISDALDGVLKVEKVYFLDDKNLVAPEPNQEYFGTSQNPGELQWLFDAASANLEGQDTLFTTETQIIDGSTVHYYLDETIFAVTWKQSIYNAAYTFSEVKIQHPSQIRRFLADGQYGSPRQYLTSQMAASVNAVVASAGDFYKYRQIGFVVDNGQVHRFYPSNMDVCLIDDEGNLNFYKDSEFESQEELQRFVTNNNIRFSLSFGPTLIQDGVRYETWSYPVGEVAGNFSRAAICQLGPLHYLLVTVNSEGMNYSYPTIHTFSNALFELGIPDAYALDGGQTATLVMNDQVINRVNYGAERYISDIVYFATALPET